MGAAGDAAGTGAPGVPGGPAGEVALARAIAAAVRAVPGVADLSLSRFAPATYGPGEVVRGVAVRRGAGDLVAAVHLCPRYEDGLVLPELAARVRRAAQRAAEALGAGALRRVDVAFDDLRVGGGPDRPGAPVRGED